MVDLGTTIAMFGLTVMTLEGLLHSNGLPPLSIALGPLTPPTKRLTTPRSLLMKPRERPAVVRSDGSIASWPPNGRMLWRRRGFGYDITPVAAVGVVVSGRLTIAPDGTASARKHLHLSPIIMTLSIAVGAALIFDANWVWWLVSFAASLTAYALTLAQNLDDIDGVLSDLVAELAEGPS